MFVLGGFAIGYVDVAIICVAVIALIVGAIGGFRNALEKGFFGRIIVLSLSLIVAIGLVHGIGNFSTPVKKLGFYTDTQQKIASSISSGSELMNSEVYYFEGVLYVTVDGKEVSMVVKVGDTILFSKYSGSEFTFDNQTLNAALSKLISPELVNSFEEPTLANIFAGMATEAIFIAGAFIVLAVVFTLLSFMLCKLIRNSSESNDGVVVFDRILGAVAQLVLAAAIVGGLLFAVFVFRENAQMAPVMEYINYSVIAGKLFELFGQFGI